MFTEKEKFEIYPQKNTTNFNNPSSKIGISNWIIKIIPKFNSLENELMNPRAHVQFINNQPKGKKKEKKNE